MKLSIIIPVYNEKNTIAHLVDRVMAVPLQNIEKEIVIVDDCSTDGTQEVLRTLESTVARVQYQTVNQGKGAAVRKGFEISTGDFILIQDADLEYDPSEYPQLLAPLLDGRADVVYGSRFIGSGPHRVLYFWHQVGNGFLTLVSNMFTNLNLSDMETCYKVFTRHALDSIKSKLTSNRFTIEVELTAQIAKHRLRIYEVGISYSGRTYAEGKKINWKDGISALAAIVKFNLFR